MNMILKSLRTAGLLMVILPLFAGLAPIAQAQDLTPLVQELGAKSFKAKIRAIEALAATGPSDHVLETVKETKVVEPPPRPRSRRQK